LDGFCRQQTNFPFLCVIVDDNSKDGEQDVIKQYLSNHFTVESIKETDDYHLTLARHKDNKNCYFAVFLLKYNHYSIKKPIRTHYQELVSGVNYLAFCEGDDYWTDEHKLQKQAGALDATPQATLVYTNFRIIDGEGKTISRPVIERFPKRSHSGDNLPSLLRYGNYVMALTTMYRYEVVQSDAFKNCPYGLDFSTTLAAALMGDFIWMPEQTGCYRSLQSGMTMSSLRKDVHWPQEIYRYYAGLVMNGQCKPLSLGQRIHLTTLILRRALARKDRQLKKDTLSASLLSYLLLPVAYINWKLKNRI
jgi:glycosyltransferase involved in cell wall biosynthesis